MGGPKGGPGRAPGAAGWLGEGGPRRPRRRGACERPAAAARPRRGAADADLPCLAADMACRLLGPLWLACLGQEARLRGRMLGLLTPTCVWQYGSSQHPACACLGPDA